MDIKTAISKTLVHEGGFQNMANDHANWSSGIIGQGTLIGTKYGITAVDMPGINISEITEDQATAYYLEHYVKQLYSQIVPQLVGEKLFDMGVLFGVGTAVAVLQLTLSVTVDKDFGPATLAALNAEEPNALLAKYKTNMMTHAFNVATANPAERGDLRGWGIRINS